MNDPIPDEDLKGLFERQRAADHERAPEFHAMRTRALAAQTANPPKMPLAWRWALPGAVAIGLGLAAVLSLHHAAKSPTAAPDTLAREFDEIDAALKGSLAAQNAAAAQFSTEPPSLFPAWASPTASLLDSPRISQ